MVVAHLLTHWFTAAALVLLPRKGPPLIERWTFAYFLECLIFRYAVCTIGVIVLIVHQRRRDENDAAAAAAEEERSQSEADEA